MKRRFAMVLAACVALSWFGGTAHAVSYSFAFDQSGYIVAPGGTVLVNVYLEETISSGDTSVLASTGVGMFSAGTMVRWDGSPQPSSPAMVLSTSAIAANAAFNNVTANVDSAYATLNGVALKPASYVHGALVAPNTYEMLIGTFSFTGGSVSGEVTHLGATAYGGGNSVNITGLGVALDGLITDQTAAITTALEGDADLDGTVNSTDLGLLLSHYNQTASTPLWATGDFNGDGTVNSTDLGVLLSHYNQVVAAEAAGGSSLASATPEPSTAALAAIAAMTLLAISGWRRRS